MSQSPKSRSLKSNLSAEAEADADSMAKTEGKFKILEGKITEEMILYMLLEDVKWRQNEIIQWHPQPGMHFATQDPARWRTYLPGYTQGYSNQLTGILNTSKWKDDRLKIANLWFDNFIIQTAKESRLNGFTGLIWPNCYNDHTDCEDRSNVLRDGTNPCRHLQQNTYPLPRYRNQSFSESRSKIEHQHYLKVIIHYIGIIRHRLLRFLGERPLNTDKLRQAVQQMQERQKIHAPKPQIKELLPTKVIKKPKINLKDFIKVAKEFQLKKYEQDEKKRRQAQDKAEKNERSIKLVQEAHDYIVETTKMIRLRYASRGYMPIPTPSVGPEENYIFRLPGEALKEGKLEEVYWAGEKGNPRAGMPWFAILQGFVNKQGKPASVPGGKTVIELANKSLEEEGIRIHVAFNAKERGFSLTAIWDEEVYEANEEARKRRDDQRRREANEDARMRRVLREVLAQRAESLRRPYPNPLGLKTTPIRKI